MPWYDSEHIENFRTSNFIETIQKDRLYIACLENSYLKGYITKKQLLKTSEILKNRLRQVPLKPCKRLVNQSYEFRKEAYTVKLHR